MHKNAQKEKKCSKSTLFLLKYLHIVKKSSNFAPKLANALSWKASRGAMRTCMCKKFARIREAINEINKKGQEYDETSTLD